MQHSLSINPITTQEMGKYSRISFEHKTPEERRAKYQEYLEKRAYIDKKTEPFNNLAIGLFLMSLILDVHHIDSLKSKLSKSQKFGIGAFILSCGATVAGMIKEIKLSKQYDLDNKS